MATNVVMNAICEGGPVRRIVSIDPRRTRHSRGRSAPPPASAWRPCRRSRRTATRITSIQIPEKIDAPARPRPRGDVQRGLAHRAADRLARGRAPTARLPTPWAMKSRFASDGPSRFGADSATPAPCTRTMAATARAPGDTSATGRSASGGAAAARPRGIAPASRYPCDAADVEDDTVGTASATIEANEASRVRVEHDSEHHRGEPVSSDGTSISPGWSTHARPSRGRTSPAAAPDAGRGSARRRCSPRRR